MKKILTLSFLCILLFEATQAQQNNADKNIPQNSFYAEIGGPGILFSANFDHRFNKSHLGFGFKAGLGFVSGYIQETPTGYFDNPSSVVTVPLQLNYIFGKSNSVHTFEVGAGVTIAGKKPSIFDFYNNSSSNVFGTASFMYRRQPKEGGFSWRIGFTPLIAKGYIQPSAGASVGYNF
ncbi:MAG: hypothetical protein ACOYKE_07300 [Ferruginibacter sp.]